MPDATQASGQTELRDEGPMIVATVPLPGVTPDQALSAFTDPVLLARWWRGELTADLVPGGEYNVWFAGIPARLTGRVLGYQPGSLLAFSWAWEGGDGPASAVTVTTTVTSNVGARLTIEHGPHAMDEAGRNVHKEHWEGWEFFLPRLAGALASDRTSYGP